MWRLMCHRNCNKTLRRSVENDKIKNNDSMQKWCLKKVILQMGSEEENCYKYMGRKEDSQGWYF